ncbi:MAG TPA: AI-2E family transporter [Steroidobacteraceae bacterium]|nr:AI-2E family transporter [Steroidobacteraceae bacterium]
MSLLTLVLVVAVLWAAKAILLPLALGIILAFALTPAVKLFDRHRLPRFAGVALTMLLALGIVGGIGYVVVDQFAELSAQLTRYTSSMRHKVAELRPGKDATLQQFTRTVDRVTEQLDDNADDLRRSQPVRVIEPRSAVERLRETGGSIFEPIASTIIVLALVAFMLGQREDLRDRFIRLLGSESVSLTTRLMDEATYRVSQFLLWQTLINLVFGALIAGGLYWIGVPYAALWGGFTAVLRFVPYVGTLLSVLMPASLAFATFPGWAETVQTLALFLSLDFVTAWFIEPLVFGRRTGVSSFALLVSALFWIWVWGPVGLLLSTPLTVCVAVLGRNVRSLRFLAVIFAEEPALTPHIRFYQRLLARDEDEATLVVERTRDELGDVGVIHEVLLPALLLVSQHRTQNEITEEDELFILDMINETVLQMVPADDSQQIAPVIGLATRTPEDQTALELLRAAVGPKAMTLVPLDLSAEDAVNETIEQRPLAVCIGAISPTRGAEVRNFCRRLRSALPETKLIVLRPLAVDVDVERSWTRLHEAGADVFVTNAKDAVEAIERLLSQTPALRPKSDPPPRASHPVSAARRSSAS